MVRTKIIIPVLILAVLGIFGCATIITGKQQSLYIVSIPPGASVHVARINIHKASPELPTDSFTSNTEYPIIPNVVSDTTISGITPCFIKVRRPVKDSLQITLTQTDYLPSTQTLKPRFNESAGLNFVIPWNWMIDAMSGSLVRYSLPDTFVLREIKKTK